MHLFPPHPGSQGFSAGLMLGVWLGIGTGVVATGRPAAFVSWLLAFLPVLFFVVTLAREAGIIVVH